MTVIKASMKSHKFLFTIHMRLCKDFGFIIPLNSIATTRLGDSDVNWVIDKRVQLSTL